MTIRLWDAESNSSTPYLQFQVGSSTNWQDATLTTLDGVAYSLSTRVAALPGGTNHSVVWNALADLPMTGPTNVLLRTRAKDISLLGDWSAPTAFQITPSPDSDNDGLPDAWELLHFGTLAFSASDDPDGDGFTNWQEYIADTNPNDGNSYLRLTLIQKVAGGVTLNWLGGVQSRQFIQRKFNLGDTNEPWLNIWTNIPPTSTTGGLFDPFSTNAATYRIRVERP